MTPFAISIHEYNGRTDEETDRQTDRQTDIGQLLVPHLHIE